MQDAFAIVVCHESGHPTVRISGEVDLTNAAIRAGLNLSPRSAGWSDLCNLWLRVGQLEAQCRNVNPTLLQESLGAA